MWYSCTQALLGLAAQLQHSGTPSTDALLMREAAYRCIGEGYNHVSPHFSFQAWCVFEHFLLAMGDGGGVMIVTKRVCMVAGAKSLLLIVCLSPSHRLDNELAPQ